MQNYIQAQEANTQNLRLILAPALLYLDQIGKRNERGLRVGLTGSVKLYGSEETLFLKNFADQNNLWKQKQAYMKLFKIIVGILLIYGIGQEYVSASKQLFSFFDPGIIGAVVLMLILCAWLLGSGLSKETFQLKSWQFLKYFGLAFVLFILVAFVSMATFKFPPDVVNVNGVNVDIAEFMNGTKRIVPDETKRRQYCICVVTKLTADKELVERYRHEFESGKFSDALMAVQNNAYADKLGLYECGEFISDK